jgi:hypothetical protein
MTKDAQGRVGNNSRKLTNLVRKYSPKKVQLTLSQGKMKKGDEVAYDGGGDALRTSVSQDQVTATLGTENCSSALSIWGGVRMVNTICSVASARFHTSQLYLNMGYKVSDKSGFFYTIIL